jgi:hypothetical protein
MSKKPIFMNYSEGILTANAGRVKVAYFEAEKHLKVIRCHDSKKIYDFPFRFTFPEFIAEVERFEKMCNPLYSKIETE